ncbi:carbohydrate ABC transporter permease [Paenibacillus humicola]|uniref:carbohydrate ABC transporter permease n=1 Tax=Paenibacillus humicola TaxID=3110540 RepID=UPI00237A173E|nr:carbohydrate ABC transporter permease [Paenibacillus humicola]
MVKGMRSQFAGLVTYLFLGLGGLASIYPFYWMLTASTLKETDIFKTPPRMLPEGRFFANVHNLAEQWPIWRALFNSLFTAGVVTISMILLSALAGYTFAKFKFKGRDMLFYIVLMTMMLPTQISLIPLFIIMTKLDWINTYYALIVPFMVSGFGVFFMRQQMLAFPDELIESARIDGGRELYIFVRIVLPTMKSPAAALGIITFLNQWGNFIWALITTNDKEMYTLPLMLSTMVSPGNVVKYGSVMAGAVIGLVPIIILFLFFQRHFISGVFSGSVKG